LHSCTEESQGCIDRIERVAESEIRRVQERVQERASSRVQERRTEDLPTLLATRGATTVCDVVVGAEKQFDLVHLLSAASANTTYYTGVNAHHLGCSSFVILRGSRAGQETIVRERERCSEFKREFKRVQEFKREFKRESSREFKREFKRERESSRERVQEFKRERERAEREREQRVCVQER
jgi:hypothetical protein